MRLFLILCAALATAMAMSSITSDQIRKLTKIVKKCQRKAHLSDEEYRYGIINEQYDNPKMKNHLFCVCKKFGYITEAGDLKMEFLKERLRTAVSEEEADRVIRKCAVTKSSPQETGANLMLCLNDHGPIFCPFD